MENNDHYVGNYCILKDIASGAFGHVYLARHVVLTNRTVAIKLLHTIHFSSPQETARFFKEAQILEKLKHPHILPIIDVGIHDGFPYLVTEYASNGSLRDYIQRQKLHRLSQEKAITILSQIGQALQYAHQQNIIHCDLKPENILFDVEGNALLADFGLAAVLTTASLKEASFAGTLAYMAPEQFKNIVCKESDQYALGCIAYELFTGCSPFNTANIATLIAQCLQTEPIPLKQHNPQISINIEAAILKALSKDRANRHSDISAFIAALSSPASALPNETHKQWETELVGITVMFPGNKDMIISACERFLQLDPDFGFAYYCKGVALYDLERYAEALAALTRSTQFDPDYASGWLYKGDILKRLGCDPEAQKAYSIAKQVEMKQDSVDPDEYDDDFPDFEDFSGFEDEEDIFDNEVDNNKDSNINGTSSSSHSITENSISFYEKGLALKDIDQYPEALEAFEQALRLNPKHAPTHCNKADILYTLFRLPDAYEAYTNALQINPYYTHAYVGVGRIFNLLARPQDALDAFEQALHLDNKNITAWVGKGEALSLLKRYNESLTSLQFALQLDSTYIDIYIHKGMTLKALGRYQEALDTYNLAIAISPTKATAAYNNKGNLLKELQRYDEAFACFEQAIQIMPTMISAYIGKGSILRVFKRYEEALEAYEEAIQIFPNYVLAHNNKGNVLADLERYDEALQAYNKAIQIDPKHANSFLGKGEVLWLLGRRVEALAAFDTCIQLDKSNIYAHYNKARLLTEIGNHTDALITLEQATQLYPDEPILYQEMGQAFLALAQYQEALYSFKRLLQITPNSRDGYVGKGVALQMLTRHQEALSAFEQAIQLTPTDAYSWAFKGATLTSMGRTKEAEEAFNVSKRLGLSLDNPNFM